MIVLLISFLTVGVYVIFFFTFYKAIKLVSKDMGFGYALVFVLSFLALLSNNNQDLSKIKPPLTVNFTANAELSDVHNTEFRIETKLFHHIDLNLGIGKIKETGKLVALSAAAYMNGMHIGTDWKAIDIQLMPVPQTDSVRYSIYASVSNRLLVFSNENTEEYNGTIVLR